MSQEEDGLQKETEHRKLLQDGDPFKKLLVFLA